MLGTVIVCTPRAVSSAGKRGDGSSQGYAKRISPVPCIDQYSSEKARPEIIDDSDTAVWLPGDVARVKNAPSRFIAASVGNAASLAGLATSSARSASIVKSTTIGLLGKSRRAVGGIGASADRSASQGESGAIVAPWSDGVGHTDVACTHASVHGSRKSCTRTSLRGGTTIPIAAHAAMAIAATRPPRRAQSARPARAAGSDIAAPASVAAAQATAPWLPK